MKVSVSLFSPCCDVFECGKDFAEVASRVELETKRFTLKYDIIVVAGTAAISLTSLFPVKKQKNKTKNKQVYLCHLHRDKRFQRL